MLRPRQVDSQYGISLVELAIGMAITILVLAVGMPGFNTWLANTRIRNVAESILNGLQTARSEAVSRNAFVDFTLVNGTGWQIGCPAVTANCPAVIQSRPAGEGANQAVTVNAALDMPIRFDSLGQMVAPVVPAGASLTSIDVDIAPSALPAAQSRELRVTVNVAGGVRLCDPNARDVRAC